MVSFFAVRGDDLVISDGEGWMQGLWDAGLPIWTSLGGVLSWAAEGTLIWSLAVIYPFCFAERLVTRNGLAVIWKSAGSG